MKLPASTIDRIKEELHRQGIHNSYLQPELCDHIATDMEQMMDQGLGEEEAWVNAFAKTSRSEIADTAKQYQGILNTRFLRLKILLWISFCLFALSWLFAPPLGPYAALLSFLAIGITLIQLSADFFRSRRNHAGNLGYAIGSLLSALLVMAGYALLFLMIRFRINTRGHGVDLMIFSYLILAGVVFLYFLRQRRLAVSREGTRKLSWFLLFSSIQLLFAILSFLSLPFYAWAVDHIWILIWAILAVNLVSLILLLIRRIRNVLFMVLLLLSFMITFIHSPLRRLLPGGIAPAPAALAAAPETSGQQMEGTWLRMGPQGPISLTFSSDGTVSCDFGMDQSIEIISAYTLNDSTISFTDIQGVTCPGTGDYFVTETGYYLGLDLKNDSCAGRVKATMGYWVRPGFEQQLNAIAGEIDKSGDPDWYLTRARIFLATGKSPEARRDLDRYIQADSLNARAYLNRAATRFPGDPQGVIPDCNRVIELEPGNKNAYFLRGLALYQLGREEEACADFYKAIELGFHVLKEAEFERCKEFWKSTQP
jgi:hypothetical protein